MDSSTLSNFRSDLDGCFLTGWQFSSLVVLPETPSSWTYTLDNQRIESEKTQSELATRQLEAVVPLLPATLGLLLHGTTQIYLIENNRIAFADKSFSQTGRGTPDEGRVRAEPLLLR